MKLWKISQNDNISYDTYDSAVVAAETEEAAKLIHPSGYQWKDNRWQLQRSDGSWLDEGKGIGSWAESPDRVTVEYIGEAAPTLEAGIVCASFNAG